MPVTSLRRFLLLSILSVVLVAGLLAGWANYRDTAEQVEELFDAEMAQQARLLRALLAREADDLSRRDNPLTYDDPEGPLEHAGSEYSTLGHKYEKKLAFEVWHTDGRLLVQSGSARQSQLPRMSAGFHDVEVNDRVWRVFVLQAPELNAWIQVAQRDDVRNELTLEIAEHAIIPLAMGLPAIALLIIGLVRLGLRPLDQVSREVRRRSYANLEPLNEEGLPAELQPLVASLNDLLIRVREHAERERQVSADIAHELRTPLAGLRIQLENASRLMDAPKGRQTLEKAVRALDRLHHLAEQLLFLARLDAQASLTKPEPIRLDHMIAELISEFEPLTQRNRQRIRTDGNVQALVWPGQPTLLFALLRNLIDNALRYSPEGSTVSIFAHEGQLEICDEGPGLAEDELPLITQRFHRAGRDTSHRSGSGIGLAIVREIARLHDLEVHFRNRPDRSGLCVSIKRRPA
ncbi:MAG: two-component sensor histidine kinase [Gammaproteobacteria bacterium]|nr:MAG: two-component sensor histidine kinase [Gammaproteobacteria bacterium]